jgi:hypothetical protein
VNAKSLLFDGVDEYLDMGDNLGTDGSTPWSFSVWINPVALTAFQNLFSKQSNTASVGPGYFVQVLGPGGGGVGSLRFGLVDSLGNFLDVYSPAGTISAGVWQHIAITYDGSGVQSGVTMYLNGTSLSLTGSGATLSATTANNNTAVIACNYNTFYGGLIQFYNGYMDELAFSFTTKWSASDIATTYGAGTPPDILGLTGLTNWYHMGDNDVYPTIADVVGGKNGTMTNMESGDITTAIP